MPAECEDRKGGSRFGSPFCPRESMAADAAWRVTGFVLRVGSCFYLAYVVSDWSRVLETELVSFCSAHENHEGEGRI